MRHKFCTVLAIVLLALPGLSWAAHQKGNLGVFVLGTGATGTSDNLKNFTANGGGLGLGAEVYFANHLAFGVQGSATLLPGFQLGGQTTNDWWFWEYGGYLKYAIPALNWFSPYVKGGFGGATITFHESGPTKTPNQTRPVLYAGTGVTLEVSPRWSLFAEALFHDAMTAGAGPAHWIAGGAGATYWFGLPKP